MFLHFRSNTNMILIVVETRSGDQSLKGLPYFHQNLNILKFAYAFRKVRSERKTVK